MALFGIFGIFGKNALDIYNMKKILLCQVIGSTFTFCLLQRKVWTCEIVKPNLYAISTSKKA